jgi:plastocyanin
MRRGRRCGRITSFGSTKGVQAMREILKPTGTVLLVCLAAVVAVATAIAASAALGDGSARSAVDKRVSVRDNTFSPRTARVGRGGRVTWVWRGDNPHNVVFRSVPRGAGKPRSRVQTSGRFSRSFRRRGLHRYVCTIHQDLGMRGAVRVG